MTKLRAFIARALMLFRRSRIETDIDQEIQSHLEMEADEQRRNGMNPDDARRAALRNFGGVDQTRERYRDCYRFRLLEEMLQDARYALRGFRRTPGFTIVAIVTLGLGIGANTAIFSVVNGVLLRPLPFKDPDRIVRLFQRRPPNSAPDNVPLRMEGISLDDLQQWRARTQTFSEIAAYRTTEFVLHEGGESVRISAAKMSPAMFSLLGVTPFLGRMFAMDEEQTGRDAVVILSYGAWRKYFGGTAEILNRILNLDSRAHTVVGVMPEEFNFPGRDVELWTPLVVNPIVRTPQERSIQLVPTLARPSDGISIDAATAEANALFVGFRREDNQYYAEHPGPDGLPLMPPTPFGVDEEVQIELVNLKDQLVTPIRAGLFILLGAVSFVLLVACTNVANLLLARAASRERELQIRMALGAGKSRLIRQTLTESVLLSIFGGVLGICVAVAGVHVLAAINFGNIPRMEAIRVDLPVLAFTAALSIVTGILFGCAPCVRLIRADAMQVGQNGSTLASLASGRFAQMRGFLVVAEVAAATILLAGSGLLIHSFMNLSNIDRGYDPDNVLTFRVGLPRLRYSMAQAQQFNEELLVRLQELPEIRLAGMGNVMPMLEEGGLGSPVFITGRPQPIRPEDIMRANVRYISSTYLSAMGMRLSVGRGFEGDLSRQSTVILINKSLAQAYFQNEDPIGQSILFGRGRVQPSGEIIGIVDDIRYGGLARGNIDGPEIYLDLQQARRIFDYETIPIPDDVVEAVPSLGPMLFATRTFRDPLQTLPRIRSIAAAMDSQAVIDDVATMEQRLSVYVVRPRFYATLLGIFAATSVCLAAIGIYGLIAYSVGLRTREIGIRLAMGCERRRVIVLVLRQGLVLLGTGILLGVVGSIALTRFLVGLLYGLTPTDPFTFMFAMGLVAVIGALASYVPARRATQIDPIIALRHE